MTMKSKVTNMENLKVSLERDRLVITGVASKPFKFEVPVDVVSIDGKLYAVPREFSAYEPIDVQAYVDEVAPDVKPSVEYTKLASGLYVPVKYVSEEVMKKLEELDTDYAAAKMMHDLQGTDGYSSYEEFEGFFMKYWAIPLEQAETLIKELQKNGFKMMFTEKVVEITGPDRDKGYAVLPPFLIYNMPLRGKWSFIGIATYTVFQRSRARALALFGQDRPKYSFYREEVEECRADVIELGKYLFNCGDGKFAVPIRPVRPIPDHYYAVKCMKVDKKLCLAISYILVHPSQRFNIRQSFGVLTDGLLKRYDYGAEKCSCGFTRDSVSVTDEPVDVISVDGEPKLVSRKYPYFIMDVGKMIVAATEVKPTVEYTRLTSGLYVPVKYVSEDVLRELHKITDVKEQAKVIIGELQKKGFGFNYSKVGIDHAEHRVEVVGPDGDKGQFIRIEDKTKQRSSDLFMGKWSPLGLAVLASSQH